MLLDGGLGCLKVHIHLVCHFFVGFELRVDSSLLRARQSILSSGARVAGQFCKFVRNPVVLSPPHQRVDQVRFDSQ